MLNRLSRKLLCLIVLATISINAFAQKGPRATPVITALAEQRVMAPTYWVAGTVISRNDARIAAETNGRLTVLANEGSSHHQGDTLAQIDDVSALASLDEAKANVAKEQANLKFLEREVQRLQRLAKQNNAAQTLLEQTLAERDASLSELAATQARQKLAEKNLARTQIRAPFDGIVVLHEKQRGEWLNSGDSVMRFSDPDALEIETMASIQLKPYLNIGATINVKAGQQKQQAKIIAVVTVADEQSGLLKVRLSLGESPWLSGQPVRVALPTALKQKVLAVPRDALVLRRGGSHLFKINAEQMAERVQVQTGIAEGDYIQVIGQLAAGDAVVTRGNERLRPGMPVKAQSSNAGASE